MHHLLLLLPLFALALFFFLPWQVALLIYVPTLVGSLFSYWKALQAMRLPVTTGEKTMIGKTAVVLRSEADLIEVTYEGEIWKATSPAKLHRGQKVIIQDVEGLTLHVLPVPAQTDHTEDQKNK